MEWSFSQPVDIKFGVGTVKKLGEIIDTYSCGVLVCDPYFKENGMAERMVEYSGNRLKHIFCDITPNPRVEEADACAELIRAVKADHAVALGGGSAIDCAKAACAAAVNDGSLRLYHSGGKKFDGCPIPLIAIPTTSGTGAEVTSVSVLTDGENKAPLADKLLYPKKALIDPELTLSMPPQVTASTGMDALSHALEGFWSVNHQPVCDAMALYAAAIIFKWLPAAYADGNNLEARIKMSEASVIAGLAFALPKTAAVHACSFPLTSVYNMPHGEACAFTLDKMCLINAESETGRLNNFAEKLFFKDARAMSGEILRMKKAMKMKTTLADAGIAEQDLNGLAEKCLHPNLKNNPVKLNAEDIKNMFLSLK